jgi:phosphoribosylanthranilate isomerase
MVETNFFAADIQNLTDARYFAAWGAQWMSFWITREDINDKGLEKYREIKEWIDGPNFAVHFSKDVPPDEMMQFAINLEADGILCTEETAELLESFGQEIALIIECRSISEIIQSNFEKFIYLADNIREAATELDQLDHTGEIYIDTDISPATISENSKLISKYGIVLRGGEEEKVGFKSYEELDEIFDLL